MFQSTRRLQKTDIDTAPAKSARTKLNYDGATLSRITRFLFTSESGERRGGGMAHAIPRPEKNQHSLRRLASHHFRTLILPSVERQAHPPAS